MFVRRWVPAPPVPPAAPAPARPKPAVPRSGPRLKLPRSATATKAGVVAIPLTNGYRQKLTGKLSATQGKRKLGSVRVTLEAGETRTKPPNAPSAPTGFDGVYGAGDGWRLVVEGGKVINFGGDMTLYCSRSAKQKLFTFGMFGDDPEPAVAADGSFAWEATTGYGTLKLTFDGRISGDTASGNMALEDRSPLLGTGRIEFDYCYGGRQWTLTRQP